MFDGGRGRLPGEVADSNDNKYHKNEHSDDKNIEFIRSTDSIVSSEDQDSIVLLTAGSPPENPISSPINVKREGRSWSSSQSSSPPEVVQHLASSPLEVVHPLASSPLASSPPEVLHPLTSSTSPFGELTSNGQPNMPPTSGSSLQCSNADQWIIPDASSGRRARQLKDTLVGRTKFGSGFSSAESDHSLLRESEESGGSPETTDGAGFSSRNGENTSSRRNSITQDDFESVDSLVLMGSTRLRPALSPKRDTFTKVYMQTYKSLFLRKDLTSAILPLAQHGNLRNSPFRSICWRVLLNVLPGTSPDWVPYLESHRGQYTYLREKYMGDHRLNDAGLNPELNNPLSQAEESPWNQHFQDGELKRLILQDVVRTFPDLEYFQQPQVRENLANILFIYAREHPDLGYRQGMHELLGPLLWVLQTDIDYYKQAKDSTEATNLSKDSAEATNQNNDDNNEEKVNNGEKMTEKDLGRVIPAHLFSKEFFEHDAYSLFDAVMEGMGQWYTSSPRIENLTRKNSLKSKLSETRPWSRPQDDDMGNVVIAKLTQIQDVLLKRHDPSLYARLEKLEIFPQIYGIRWLRLLFGREFLFHDTLVLWDAIFADSCPPGLADQMVVSLLMAVRERILNSEYPEVVSLLMKLPTNIDVSYIVSHALHLKDPLRFAKPPGSPFHSGSLPKQEQNGTSSDLATKSFAPSRIFRKMSGKNVTKEQKTSKVSRELPDFTVVDIKSDKKEEPFEICDNDCDKDKKIDELNKLIQESQAALNTQLSLLKTLLKPQNLMEAEKISGSLVKMQKICDNLSGQNEELSSKPNKKKPVDFFLEADEEEPVKISKIHLYQPFSMVQMSPVHHPEAVKSMKDSNLKRDPSIAMDASSYFEKISLDE